MGRAQPYATDLVVRAGDDPDSVATPLRFGPPAGVGRAESGGSALLIPATFRPGESERSGGE